MRNVSGYLTDDGKFFTDKKEAEAHERFTSMGKHIEAFVQIHFDKPTSTEYLKDWIETLKAWERYRAEVTK